MKLLVLLLFLLIPRPIVDFHLTASDTVVPPSASWHYTITAKSPRPTHVTIIDPIDTRLQVTELSPGCSEAGNVVQCDVALTPGTTATMTITVRIRKNPCEPIACRDRNWTIHNQAWVNGVPSEVVAVQIDAWPERQRPRRLFLPLLIL